MQTSILTDEQYERLSVNKELDFSIPFSEKGRFRINAYTQKNSLAAAFRLIPLTVPTIEALNLPKILHSFTSLRQGLVLVTGPTGHGKTTTLASMIQEINTNRATHIITIEDPVEFVFNPVKSIISQREMRSDTHSWEIALRSALREDPDVVFVGEMRDYETIAAALTVALGAGAVPDNTTVSHGAAGRAPQAAANAPCISRDDAVRHGSAGVAPYAAAITV